MDVVVRFTLIYGLVATAQIRKILTSPETGLVFQDNVIYL
jgi:hypothetical protein